LGGDLIEPCKGEPPQTSLSLWSSPTRCGELQRRGRSMALPKCRRWNELLPYTFGNLRRLTDCTLLACAMPACT
jgi:hypothetical protein